jgi:hypothetical protein
MKTFKKILLICSYALVAAIIAGGTLLLVSYGQGRSYDFKTHKFVSNGLLILGTTPSGARLTIGDKLTRRTTPYRSTYRVGQYDIKLTKDGYRPWSKRVNIVASEVVNLALIIMVPEKLQKETVASALDVSSIVASSDHKHVAAITAGEKPGLWRLTADRATAEKIYTPGDGQQIQSGTLSRDGSRALLKVQYPDGVRQLYIDMGNGNVQDLSSDFKVALDDVRFSFSDSNRLYWLSGDGLRRIDVNSKTLSAVLADKVVNYTYDNDRVIYIQSAKVGKVIAVMDADGRNQKTLVEGVAESPNYLLSYASFRDKDDLAVVPTVTGQLTVYESIYSDNVVSRTVTRDVNKVLPSDDGHYFVFAHSQGFGSYDIGRAKIYDGLYKDKVDAISWFNGAHVIVNSGDKTRLVEFDGGNSTDLGTSSLGIPSVGMHDQRRVLYVDAKSKQVIVTDLKK